MGEFNKYFNMQEALLWPPDPTSLSTAVMNSVVQGANWVIMSYIWLIMG